MSIDVYQVVTDRIISELEKGEIPWKKPWIGGSNCAYSYSTVKPYCFINQILLGCSGEYISFNECAANGGHVKKGEQGHKVVSWAKIKEKVMLENGDEREELLLLPRLYTVFEISQCEGITRKHEIDTRTFEHDPIEEAEKIISAYLEHEPLLFKPTEHSAQAYYSPSTDTVVVPQIQQFPEISEYYSTVFHELTHSTGHVTRLNRLSTGKSAAFGSNDYSKEELVAELGAAAICNYVGIETESSFRNSTAYIQNWIKALKDDKRLIIGASARADKAVEYILS